MMMGLGTMYKTDPTTGNVIDCDSVSNIFQSVCWNPTAPTVVPSNPSNPVGSPAATGACVSTFVSGVCDTNLYIGAAAAIGLLVFLKMR